MSRHPRPAGVRPHAVDDRGIAAAELSVGLVIALVVFATLLNGAFVVYGKAVVRGALHEGVRAGSVVPAGAEECRQRIGAALDSMLGPYYRSGVTFSCTADDTRVVATATANLRGFVPGVPDVALQLDASALKEQDPTEEDAAEEQDT
jgi:hypothetical protein